MLKIYLTRHGQDQDNANGILNGQRDEPLTPIGIDQAHEIAEKIADSGLSFDKAYASPLQRALKTAEIITNKLNMPNPEVMDLLIERDFGILTGQPHSKIKEICGDNTFKTSTINYFLDPEGAETFPMLIERGKKVISKINEVHKSCNILLVTHGDFGKMLYAAYYNLNWQDVLKMFHFGNGDLILLSPDSASTNAHVFQLKQHNV